MSGPVIDLDAAREARDSATRLGRIMAQCYTGSVVAAVHRWSDRTDSVMAPIANTDAEAARALVKWGARRLRAEVRRILADLSPEAKADTVAIAESAFASALITLADRRAAGKVAE